MNRLQWILTQLTETIIEYAVRNDDYRKIHELNRAEVPSTDTVKLTPSVAPAKTYNFGSVSAAITSTATSSVSTQTQPQTTSNAPNISPITTTTADAVAKAAVSTNGAADKIDSSPSLLSRIIYTGAEYLVPAHNALKAKKATEANMFIATLKAKLDELPGVYELKDVREKLSSILELVNMEIQLIGIHRSEYKTDDLAAPKTKDRSELDALLGVYKTMLEWLLKPSNLELLCISLKSDECKQTMVTRKPNTVNEVKISYSVPIPLTKELISNLMTYILTLQLDIARKTEAAILKHTPQVPESAIDDLMRELPSAILELNQFNAMYTTCLNDSSIVGGSKEFSERADRLSNTCMILGSLCYEIGNIRTDNDPTFSLTTTFLSQLHAAINKWYMEAKTKLRDRTKLTLSTEVAAPAKAMPNF